MSGSGGLAAVSADIPAWLLLLVLVIVVVAGWKLSKFVWLIFK
jgi:hypothetical protein